MKNEIIGLVVFAVAMLTSVMVFPQALKFARRHGIVDNPNARKLQRRPVPVFGGVVVYTGILAGMLLLWLLMPNRILPFSIAGMTIMMAIGAWDDMKDISPILRLVIEIVVVTGFILLSGRYIDDLHGLWGLYDLSPWVGIPLSVFVGVGAINAVNLIDGVDGYSSSYGILSCVCYGLAFLTVWNPVMVCMTMIVTGALIPFFLHNVFGAKSKMFIGDSGTLMLGMVIVVMAFCALSSRSRLEALVDEGMCLPAFVIAVSVIPLFDTVRVMTMRMLRGHSPIKPDKTHLHHLFIDMGFSHLGAATYILFINLFVVLIWLASWQLGASLDMQLYIVVFLGFMVTFVFYHVMRVQQNGGPVDEEGYPQGTWLWHFMRRLGRHTHREDKWMWRTLKYLVDGPLLGGGKIKHSLQAKRPRSSERLKIKH